MKTILISIAVGSLLAALATAQPQPRYIVTDLDPRDGFGQGFAVNNAGSVAGVAIPPGYPAQRATLWRQGQEINLGSLGGLYSNSAASGMNGRDAVALISDASTPDPLGEDFCVFGTHQICLGAVWANWALTPLSPLPGGRNSQANSVNNRGEVAGLAETGTHDPSCATATPSQILRYEPVIWGPNLDEIRALPLLRNDTVGFALGINDSGQAVGTSGTCATTTLVPVIVGPHAVLWDDGSATDLGSLSPGSATNTAAAVNNRTEVVGASEVSSGALHSFLWTSAAGMRDLGVISDENGTDLGSLPGLAGINNAGQVVGISCINDPRCNFFNPSFLGRAYLWQNGKMMDLNSLVQGNSPLFLAAALGINEAGEITGLGVDANGTPHAFVAKPVHSNDAGQVISFAERRSASPRVLTEGGRKLLRRQLGIAGR